MVRSLPVISSTIKGVKLINNAILRCEQMIRSSSTFVPKQERSKREPLVNLIKVKVLGIVDQAYSVSPRRKALAYVKESAILAHTKPLVRMDNHVARF